MATLTPAAGSLSLSGVAPGLTLALPARGLLTLTGLAPLRMGLVMGPAAGSLTLTPTTPVRLIKVWAFGAVGTLSLSGIAPNPQWILTTITGSIYNGATGAKVTTGKLFIRPKSFIQFGGNIVAPQTITYSIPGTGNISLPLAASNGVPYIVEFDPDPADTATPFRLKSGYFSDEWIVPASGTIDISKL